MSAACASMQLLLQAELDGELDAADAAALAAHLDACAGCSQTRAQLSTLSTAIRAGASRHPAPLPLHGAVRTALRTRQARWFGSLSWRDGLAYGFGMATAAALALLVLPPHGGAVSDEIVAAHIRGLQPGHLTDVASTDQHTVKPWFDGRLDYAPPVHDFTAAGFPLIGGRLDYVAHRPVAVLIYRRDKHLIDVFVWPGSRAGADTQIQGYNVVSWSRNGMVFEAVSDLNTRELGDLASLFKAG
jgi:anti-sigma factor RsiW